MLEDYEDIILKLGTPSWYDSNGVPRYCAFSPRKCSVYIDAVALLRIACQECGKEFIVASECDISRNRLFCSRFDWQMTRPNPSGGSIGTFHYGDPPSYGHCCAGPTMNCDGLEVLEFWERHPGDWERHLECEGVLVFDDTTDSTETARGGYECRN